MSEYDPRPDKKPPFTFDFGDGVEITADDVPEGPEKQMMEEIATTMGGFGIKGIVWASSEDPEVKKCGSGR